MEGAYEWISQLQKDHTPLRQEYTWAGQPMEVHAVEIIMIEDMTGVDMMIVNTTAETLTEVAEGGVADRTETSFLGEDLHHHTTAEVDIDHDPDHVLILHVDIES